MIVVEASVMAYALARMSALSDRCRAELARDEHWCAPQHFVAEMASAVRSMWWRGEVTEAAALGVLDAVSRLEIEEQGVRPLLPRIWELRHNLSTYDAACAALAEAFECPLLTADGGLARAPGLRCDVRLVAEAV
ncbi:MAG: type II toxin-antitoxin system VapC family toxin [bacterium]|jgi:predicted nucleic acid-binding protein|nr:type II toxin-antitoxin system VapC family toxin [bacterium]